MDIARRLLIEKLVIDLHLDMEERRLLGTKTVKLSEVEEVIWEQLKQFKSFPPGAKVWNAGERAYEGFFIEQISAFEFKLHYQEVGPIYNEFRYHSEKIFNNIDSVIEEFIKSELKYDIDGIKIEREK